MHVSLTADNQLALTFRYDPRVIAAVKTITGRAFDPARKRWTVPAEHVLEAMTALKPFGFTCDPEVKRIKERIEERKEVLAGIRAGSGTYAGSLPLFDFQKVGASFIRETTTGVLLADVPGLGKTIQTIAAFEDSAGPILVIAPASLKYGWKDELDKWTGQIQNSIVIDGSKNDRRDAWQSGRFNKVKWLIMNYELLLREDIDEIAQFEWAGIVCDEATRISNNKAKTTQLLKTIPAKKKLALTGTPVSNTPLDIWSIVDWVSPGFLGNFWQFKNRYCEEEEDWFGHKHITGFVHLDELSDKLLPVMLRRTKEEVLKDFPAKTSQLVKFDLSKEEKKLYKSIQNHILEELSGMKESGKTAHLGMALVKLLRLKQATDHPKLVESDVESSKLEAMKELLRPVFESGEKAIVFTQFAEMAEILIRSIPAVKVWCIQGSVASEARQEYVREFTEHAGAGVMVMTEAGAYGLNLQAASCVIHYDLPWSVAKLVQREDRAHRIGQTKPVTVYSLIAKNTVDEYIVKVLHAKSKYSMDILKDADRIEAMTISAEDVDKLLEEV